MTDKATRQSHLRAKVLAIVAAIPEGRVTTYGAIGKWIHTGPRQVAAVLASLTPRESQSLPWFRVVGAQGAIRTMERTSVGRRQIARLKAEGIMVTPANRVEQFKLVAWTPELGGVAFQLDDGPDDFR